MDKRIKNKQYKWGNTLEYPSIKIIKTKINWYYTISKKEYEKLKQYKPYCPFCEIENKK